MQFKTGGGGDQPTSAWGKRGSLSTSCANPMDVGMAEISNSRRHISDGEKIYHGASIETNGPLKKIRAG